MAKSVTISYASESTLCSFEWVKVKRLLLPWTFFLLSQYSFPFNLYLIRKVCRPIRPMLIYYVLCSDLEFCQGGFDKMIRYCIALKTQRGCKFRVSCSSFLYPNVYGKIKLWHNIRLIIGYLFSCYSLLPVSSAAVVPIYHVPYPHGKENQDGFDSTMYAEPEHEYKPHPQNLYTSSIPIQPPPTFHPIPVHDNDSMPRPAPLTVPPKPFKDTRVFEDVDMHAVEASLLNSVFAL